MRGGEVIKFPSRHSSDEVEVARRAPAAQSFKEDEAFKNLIPPRTDQEFAILEAAVKEEGCRDALTGWKEAGILIDGYHRLRICRANGVDFKINWLSFPDHESALLWALERHIKEPGEKRGHTPDALRYLRGRCYNLRKGRIGGDRRRAGSEKQNVPGRVCEAMALELACGKESIFNAGKYASAIDAISETHPALKLEILSRSLRLTVEQVSTVAAADPASREATARRLASRQKNERDEGSDIDAGERDNSDDELVSDPEGPRASAGAQPEDPEEKPTKRVGNYRTRDPEEIAKDARIGKFLADGMTTAEAAEAANVTIGRVTRAKQNLGLCRPNTLLDRIVFQARTGADSLALVLEAVEKNHIDGNAEQWSQLAEALKNARASAEKAIKRVNGRKQ